MRKITLLCCAVLCTVFSKAQVTGVKTIGVDYPTVAAAVTALNTTGVGAGGATINLPAGYTETAPSGGFVLGTTLLNASLNAGNPLVFQKGGAGVNPVLTAFTGGTSTTSDGVFKLAGTDYVTIDGINIVENAANTAAAFMEWGYALVNLNAAAPFDGCQNVTIKNCAVTLDRTNPNGAFGIYSAHNIATNSTALTITATGDLHSNNKFYANTISNVNEGFWILGFAAASPYTLYDQNNDIGGTSAATGNTVKTMGVTALFNTFCIYLVNQNAVNASYNTIDNGAGATISSTTQLIGIYTGGTTSTATVNNNNITLTETGGTAIVAGAYTASTGTLIANNNTIVFADAAGSGTHYGIFSSSVATTTINANSFSVSNSGTVTSAYYCIYNNAAATTATITNNVISNINTNTTGTTAGIYNAAAPAVYNVSNNTFSNIIRTGASGTHYCIYTGSPATGTFNANTADGISFTTVTSTGTIYGIYDISSGVVMNYTNNVIKNFSTPATGTLYGIREFGVAGNKTIQNNQVSNFSTSPGGAGGTSMTGISWLTGGAADDISNNKVFSLNSTGTTGGTGGTIIGILCSGGTTNNIYKNKVYDLSTNSTGATLWGMQVTSGTTNNVYNNYVGDLRTPALNTAITLAGINFSGGTTDNAYYNTVYLNATSTGATFGSTALYASSTPTVTLRNNIFVNNSTPKGAAGFTTAYRRTSATLTTYGATSNNNLFYAGGGCASSLIYYDGTNSDQTLTTFQTRVTPRDAASKTENPNFLSTSGASVNFLHINTATATQIEGGAAPIATFTDDFDGDVRNATTPDIGADEFTGTVAAACSGTPVAGTATAASNPLCAGLANTICLSGQTLGVTGITYQWQSGTSATGPFTAIACANSSCFNTGILTAGTYYYNCVVTCTNGGASATSNVVTLVVNPTPVVTVSPLNPAICSGFSTPLTASGAATYTWSPATGLSATTGATVTASPATTTTYSVIGIDAAGCSSAATNSIITVNTPPVLATSTATPAVICVGSNSQLLAGPAAPSVYCNGTYSSGTGSGDYITNVTLGTINNTTGASATPYYTYYNALNTNLTVGNAYTITGTINNGGTEYVAVWIDYNQNGVFETAEKIGEQASLTFSLPFTVPAGTLNGVTRMRVMNVYNTAGILPCGAYTFGEIEDYNVTIVGGGTYTYLWTPATFLSSTTIANPVATGVTATTTYTVKVTGPNGCFSTNTVTVTIDPTAYAVTGGGSYCTSGAGLSVGLAGSQTGVTYQLKLNGATNIGAPVAGTGAAISFGNQTAAGTYTVVATNTTSTCSNNMTGSAIVALYPVVTVTPALTQPATCVSADGAIAIALSGAPGPYTFAWTGNGVIAAAQNQTNLTAGSYSVKVTDGNGCSTTTPIGLTGPGGCTVCPTVGSVTTNPTPAGCIGANITLTASGLTSMGVTYGITFKSFTAATADPYTGGTVLATVPNASLTAGGTVATATGTFATANTYFIYAILTPAPIDAGCRPSAVTNFVINPSATATATPASQSVCSGGTITTIALSGTITGTTYSWTRDNAATVTGIAAAGTGNISGALTNNTGAPITVTFTITPTANGCAGTPTTATVLVNPTTTAVATPASQTICSAGTLTPITLTGVAGTTFTWTRDNTATVVGGIPASGSGSSITGFLTNLTTAPVTVTFTITPTANGCTGAPITATVVVNPFASAVATPATQTACSGSPITTIALTSNVTGTTYSWTRDNTVTLTGIAAAGTGSISGTLVNTGITAVTTTFTITPSFAGCPGPSITATVTVNPTPAVTQPGNQTLCNGATTSAVSFAGTLAGTTYSWTNNTTSIGLAASGTGNIAAFIATNTGTAPVTATITVTPSLNGCTGTAKTFTITVNPTANVTAVSNQTLCTGAATTAVAFTGTVAGTTYSWTNNTPSIGLAASGTGNIASFTAVNTTSTAVTATITVTPTAAGCPGTAKTFTITVNGQSVAPTGATASNIALCGPGTADLTVQGGALGTGASWKWYSGSCGGTLIGTGATITGVAVSGTATFYVRAEGTCNTTTCASVTVTVNPQPVITLSAAPYTSLVPPLVTGITANITPVSATNTIVWFKDGVVINGATTNTLSGITVDQLGSYTARVTTTAGCTALSAPLVIKDSASSKLFILPNPNNGQFKIRYYTSARNFGFFRTVTIYDSKGSRVFSKAIPITAAYSTMDIDIRNSGKGLFIVVVGDSEGKELITGKVVVQ
jgi:trimeric autotransporter adhesin